MGLIDLTGFGSALNALSFVYWAVAIFALYLARKKPASARSKTMWTIIVVLVFGFLPVMGLIHNAERNSEAQKMKTHVVEGDERFKAYCQKAGVKINRVVEDVEGVYLMKVRTGRNQNNQYAMDDPYGDDAIGDRYIGTFLKGRDKNGTFVDGAEDLPGYRFVEAIDPKDGKLYRFTAHIEWPGLTDPSYAKDYVRFVLEREPIAQRTARYGVTYDDISTKEDRDYWIAGSSLRVIDLDTNEVIAERIGYKMDYGQGPDGAARQGWTYARDNACPPLHTSGANQTREFTEQSLHIAK